MVDWMQVIYMATTMTWYVLRKRSGEWVQCWCLPASCSSVTMLTADSTALRSCFAD